LRPPYRRRESSRACCGIAGVLSGSHEAEFVAVRVSDRELARPVRRVEERLNDDDDAVLDVRPQCVGSSMLKLNRAPRPSASITANVAPPADLRWA